MGLVVLPIGFEPKIAGFGLRFLVVQAKIPERIVIRGEKRDFVFVGRERIRASLGVA